MMIKIDLRSEFTARPTEGMVEAVVRKIDDAHPFAHRGENLHAEAGAHVESPVPRPLGA